MEGSELKELHDAVKACFEAHKKYNKIYVSNGLLIATERNDALRKLLNNDELDFLDRSGVKFNEALAKRRLTNDEYSKALIESEDRAAALAQAKERAELAEREAQEARYEAEQLAAKRQDSLQQIRKKVLDQEQMQMAKESQKFQHKLGWWVFGAMFSVLMYLMTWLMFLKSIGAGNTDQETLMLGTSLGSFFTACAAVLMFLYTPWQKEEKPKPNEADKSKYDI